MRNAIGLAQNNDVFGHRVQQHKFPISRQIKWLVIVVWLAKDRLLDYLQHLRLGP